MVTFISLFLIICTIIYISVLIYLSSGLNRLKNQKRSQAQPKVSVIVCAHNEQRNLPDCIKLLSTQNYPKEKIEFILVNDRSTDNTEFLMQQACKQDNRFKTFTITDRIDSFAPKKRAIDTAIRKSNDASQLILLTDADGRPGDEWVTKMVSYFDDTTDMVIGYAPYKIKPAGHFAKSILALEYLSHAAIAAATTGLNYPITCVGTNMAYRKKLYFDVDGFAEFKNQISGDDDLFLTHVREQKKHKISYATSAKTHVYNNPPRLWLKFIHQRMRYASKGFKYPFKVTIALITYFSYNLLLLILSLSAFINRDLFMIFMFTLLLKWLAEFLFMYKAGKLLSDLRTFKIFIFAALFHIPYVVIFALLGQFDYFKWAEEHAESGVLQQAGTTK